MKTFDCVEMKRRGARRVEEATAGMTLAERIRYWRDRDFELLREQKALSEPGGEPKGEDVTDAEFEERSEK